MTADEIRHVCIESAKAYYEYLQENEKGMQQVDVYDLQYLPDPDVIIKLRLSAKLFDTETISFKLSHANKTYGIGPIKVIEYDGDKNILVIKPAEELKAEFVNLKARDVKIVSDLKFLIERVKKWYEVNGADLALPQKASRLKESLGNIKYVAKKPSAVQQVSIKNIFTNPFSYVWGAPGTGKTQFVLSYALLHYLSHSKRVAILAPTNNAIEQVLRGVLEMSDLAGIQRTRFLRLGTPSKTFAEEYPEVCEEKSTQRKLTTLDKQIGIVEQAINLLTRVNLLKQSTFYLSEIGKLTVLKSTLDIISERLEISDAYIRETELEINKVDKELTAIQRQIQYVDHSGWSLMKTIKQLFAPSRYTRIPLATLKIEYLNVTTKKEQLDEYLNNGYNNKLQLDIEKQDIRQAIDQKLQAIQEYISLLMAGADVIPEMTLENIAPIKQQLQRFVNQEAASIAADQHIYAEYRHYTVEQLTQQLADLKQTYDSIKELSTEERIKSTDVIACTLDGYIGRFLDKKLKVDHFFLDEAGYANMIKALTLFTNDTPVTFLGDHKQLPPVCEINDTDIQQNEKLHNTFLWSQSAIHLESVFLKNLDAVRNEYLQNQPCTQTIMVRTALNSTFRFGPNLAAVLSRHVYENDFISQAGKDQTSISVIDAKKQEGAKSRISINEVYAIKKITSGLDHDDYVILTPYSKQLQLLGEYLPDDRSNLRILTVHGSQGREWRTVILSVVDTYDKWFVDSTSPRSKGLNLINTAVSRAKKELIIVCDKAYWKYQPTQLITDLLKTAEQYA
ncbi:hypothetical protein EXU57_22595 [Segetibacter sp. 3557_3]|uniref:DEAD/DEAH box helicase n=1 Tax=Segetibacter sp. 3557_3 TaxID=2547429 RepID=UPI001058BDCD|nr:AAA domain-containing protein [Segetibacter sp. 3557_3]TDH19699.1 hypothetical protein EXU57_22595 [Segetibacter sp. 3557_3]